MKDDVLKSPDGGTPYGRYYPMSRGERAIWAAAYAKILGREGFCATADILALAAREAGWRVLELRRVVAEKMRPREGEDEMDFMAREMVCLEAALGPAYQQWVSDPTCREVGDEVESLLMGLEHLGFREAAAAVRRAVRRPVDDEDSCDNSGESRVEAYSRGFNYLVSVIMKGRKTPGKKSGCLRIYGNGDVDCSEAPSDWASTSAEWCVACQARLMVCGALVGGMEGARKMPAWHEQAGMPFPKVRDFVEVGGLDGSLRRRRRCRVVGLSGSRAIVVSVGEMFMRLEDCDRWWLDGSKSGQEVGVE